MNIFQRIRRHVIIMTAESYYRKMVARCDELHRTTGKHHYIIIEPWTGSSVTITNRDQFRKTKRAINDSGIRMAARSGTSPMLTGSTMPDVHDGCFYSSMMGMMLAMAEKTGNTGSARSIRSDIEARRRCYVEWTLAHARQRRSARQRREERVIRRELERYKRKTHRH